MKLTSAKIVKRLKPKKITKPASFSTKDTFLFYCNNKIKNNSAYYLKEDTLYLNVDHQLDLLEEEISNRREEYIVACEELSESPYDFDCKKKTDKLKARLRVLTNRVVDLDTTPTKNVFIVDLEMFKNIIFTYNKQAQDEIIDGKRLNLKNGLGYIEARIVERNFKKKTIDHNETQKRKRALLASGTKEEDLYHSVKNPNGGTKYTVFVTDDDWCRLSWDKMGKCKNVSVYEFKPTDSRSRFDGFKNRFSKAIKDNPLVKLKYKRYSYI